MTSDRITAIGNQDDVKPDDHAAQATDVAGALGQVIVADRGGVGSEHGSGAWIDLTANSFVEVRNRCQALVDSGVVVLHGSNTPMPVRQLEARLGNDAAKASGNQRALYATLLVDVALAYAIFNRRAAIATLGSFVLGHRNEGDRLVFDATDDLYEMFARDDPRLFSDGYVYALDRSQFLRAGDTVTEYYSPVSRVPITVMKVSGRLHEQVFTLGADGGRQTIRRYASEEIGRIAAHVRRIEG